MFELVSEKLFCKLIGYRLSYRNLDLYDVYDTMDQQMRTLVVFEEKNKGDSLTFKELSGRFKKLTGICKLKSARALYQDNGEGE